MDPRIWITIAFAAFLLLVYRPIGRLASKALDKRSNAIAHELAEAVRLREEAQATLAAYQEKHRQISAEAEEILRHARESAEQLQKEAQEDVKRAVESRIAQADEKIAREEQKAIQDVQKQVVEVAIEAARSVIVDNYQTEADDRLITLAVKDIQRVVH